jgi:hypothetical protein
MVWITPLETTDSHVGECSVLGLITSQTVRYITVEMTNDERSALSSDLAGSWELDLWIVPKETDRQLLFDGEELPLEKCSIFIQDKAKVLLSSLMTWK